jgi:cyanamide hydratase
MSHQQQLDIREYGWTAVPRDRSNVPSADDVLGTVGGITDLEKLWPITDVTIKAREYAKNELRTETYNHSLRVFCYGTHSFPTPT